MTAPLRHRTFRRIWVASLVSNLGSLIQGVGVAWAMTEMSSSADKVALVQTALGLPVMLIAIPAGAIADLHDRRIVALSSLGIALTATTTLTALAWLGLLTPDLLLALCFAAGCGTAMLGPAWQAAVSEQVPPHAVPAAVALNGISYNIARSVGPAIGGIIVATAGTVAAFALNALSFLPLIGALYLWKRAAERSRLPPERLGPAIILGVRYIANSPLITIVLVRTVVMGLISGVILALLPLVARDLLLGSAPTYGLLLGAFGLGAVIGAANIALLRKQLSSEAAMRCCALAMAAGIAVIAVSRNPLLSALGLAVGGAGWTLSWTLLNIGVQLSAPRWVAARSLAAYQAAASGGLALGSWGWGHLADTSGVETTLLIAAGLMLASPLIGLRLRMPPVAVRVEEGSLLEDPAVRMPVVGRDGPIVIEIEYKLMEPNSRGFREMMQDLKLVRQRNGAYAWSVARDMADPEKWIERYQFHTWHDYLRQRSRPTQVERALEARIIKAFHAGPGKVRVRRTVECGRDKS
ncbi:MFS transporter [Bradyrhizobium sp. 153]|uniref:MFS transporter n=1 Tax=Bradyrhizobium sp. 153 TaxID=2782627 RepID=UPI001FF86974